MLDIKFLRANPDVVKENIRKKFQDEKLPLVDEVIGLDKELYEDARKEFNLASMTGFGADGGREIKELDFSEVRGDFESNSFVTAVLDHIRNKEALGNELIERLKR